MSNKRRGCSKCHEETCKCSRPKDLCYEEGCEKIIPAECVIYEPKGSTSFLKCYLDIATKTSLKEILETLDYKLCNAFTLQVDTCIADLLGIQGREVDYKIFLNKLSNHICNSADRFVKVSPTDTQSGYLFDKINVGQCLIKRIIRDGNNVERVEVSLDFDCLASKMGTSSCIEVDCCGSGGFPPSYIPLQIATNTPTVCGSSVATLTATTQCQAIFWFRDNVLIASGSEKTITVNTTGSYFAICKAANGDTVSLSNSIKITHTGVCTCEDTVWVFTGRERCQNGVSQLERRSNCMNFTWVAGGNACPAPCVPVWSPAIPLNILCGSAVNTLLGTNTYNNCLLYEQQSNQCNSDKRWMPYEGSPDPEFEGCCPPCVSTGITTCSSSIDSISFKDNCGTTLKSVTLSTLTRSCTSEDQINLTAAITYGANSSASDFDILYSLAGPTNRPLQSSNVFTNIAAGNYTVTLSVKLKTNTAIGCTATKAASVVTCEEVCTDPAPTITISLGDQDDEVCRYDLRTITSTKSNCTTTTWYKDGVSVYTGNTLSISMIDDETNVITAKCSNCNSEATSNAITLTRKDDCIVHYKITKCSDEEEYCTMDAPVDQILDRRYQDSEGEFYTYANLLPFNGPCLDTAIELTVVTGKTGCTDPEPEVTRYYEVYNCVTEENLYVLLDLSSYPTNQRVTITGDVTATYTGDYLDSETVPSNLTSIVSVVTGKTNCTDPVFTTYYEVEKCDGSGNVYVDIDLSEMELNTRVDLGGGEYATYTGDSESLEEAPSNLVEGAVVTEIIGCPIPYYKVYECEFGTLEYTTTDLASFTVGTRFERATGGYYTHDGTIHYSDTVIGTAFALTDTGEEGCPPKYYIVMECETLDQYYTTIDLSALATNERVSINSTLIGTYTGSYDILLTPPSNLASTVVSLEEDGCPEPPEEITYYVVLRCSDQSEGFVELDLSGATVDDRVDLGSDEFATYTGDTHVSSTVPSPLWVATTTTETGCPE